MKKSIAYYLSLSIPTFVHNLSPKHDQSNIHINSTFTIPMETGTFVSAPYWNKNLFCGFQILRLRDENATKMCQ